MQPDFPQNLPAVVVVAAATSGLVSWFLKLWWETRIKDASQKALVEFKDNLDRTAAAAGFDYQRRLQDFNLFVTKKHEALAQLHELQLEAMSQIVRFAIGAVDRALLSDRNADDAEDYLKEHAQIPRGKREEILALWDTDREEAIRLLYAFQDGMQGEYVRRAWTKANNYRLGCDLYLPEPISQTAATLMGRLERLRLAADLEEQQGTAPLRIEADAIQDLFRELKGMMRAEMSRSDY